ncbi:MAG TPA: zinc-binding dehydrogenase [Verrucomicrobiae bacterium]|nr:zinc-binding dehydrogenase [Verrucomicrobiae bacterium]
MRAAVLENPGRVSLQRVKLPEPAEGWVRVKLEGCGVCGSNLPPWEGRPWFKYPLAPGELGHEGWGRVDALGPKTSRFKIGERVTMLSYHAYAEYDIADENDLVRLPEELDARPFPGEPLACAMNIFQRSEIQPGQTVAVVGIGFLGALLTSLCSQAGAQVIAISRRPFALEMARRCGAAETIVLKDCKYIQDHVRKLTNGRGCERVIEAVGLQEALDLATELTRERGRLVIAGYHQDGLRQINMQLWNWRGLDVINAHERDRRNYVTGMEAAVRAVESGQLDPSFLYTHQFSLEQLGEAFDAMRDRPDQFLKGLIVL